jgi:hypothetical protein
MSRLDVLRMAGAYRPNQIVLLNRNNVVRATGPVRALFHPQQADRAFRRLAQVSQVVARSAPLSFSGGITSSFWGGRVTVGKWETSVLNMSKLLVEDPFAEKFFPKYLSWHNIQLPVVEARLVRGKGYYLLPDPGEALGPPRKSEHVAGSGGSHRPAGERTRALAARVHECERVIQNLEARLSRISVSMAQTPPATPMSPAGPEAASMIPVGSSTPRAQSGLYITRIQVGMEQAGSSFAQARPGSHVVETPEDRKPVGALAALVRSRKLANGIPAGSPMMPVQPGVPSQPRMRSAATSTYDLLGPARLRRIDFSGFPSSERPSLVKPRLSTSPEAMLQPALSSPAFLAELKAKLHAISLVATRRGGWDGEAVSI